MSPPRVPPVDPEALTPEQQEVWDRIAAGPRGRVEGPLRVWLNRPAFADRAQALGQYARFETSLPPRISEMVILVTARIWSAGFEWSAHAPIAREAGLPEAFIAAIAEARIPDLPGAADRAAFHYAVALHRDRAVPDAVHAAAETTLGRDGVIDLVAICGYYTLISMSIVGFGVPEGEGPQLPEIGLRPEEMFR